MHDEEFESQNVFSEHAASEGGSWTSASTWCLFVRGLGGESW